MSKKDLLIAKNGSSIKLALLEDERLVELHTEEINNNISVGDIFIGKVRKLLPSLNAAFIDIGFSKDAFLHYSDLGNQFKIIDKFIRGVKNEKQKSFNLNDLKFDNSLDKEGHISSTISSGQSILVQVTKEPISTKGPRLSCEISIAGRYVILIPFSDKIFISQKIEDKEEKDRLRKIISNIKPKGFGVIIRTVAEKKDAEELAKDLKELLGKWKDIFINVRDKKEPSVILKEENRASTIIRDIFDKKFKNIEVDDKIIYSEIKDYIKYIYPEKEKIVKYYSDKSIPLFEKYSVERQLKSSFGKVVHMLKGSYLIIEHTEAMHVIDVNSGNKATNSDDQEQNALTVNLIAAKEIARQLRLRDMGGIIVIDFIDQKNSENRKILYEKFCEFMEEDKAKHKILPPSKFGLIQLTRQRVRPQMNIDIREELYNGSSELIDAPITLISKIESNVSRIIFDGNKDINIHVHPFVAAYFKIGIISLRRKWSWKYKTKIKIVERNGYKYLEYNILDKNGNILNNEVDKIDDINNYEDD